MGSWAKKRFGTERFDSTVGIVIAGTATKAVEDFVIGLFDEVVFQEDAVYHSYLVRKGENEYPVVLNVYGAPAMIDVLAEMYDGGVQNVLFIGYAYGGFKDFSVGTLVSAHKAYHYDGIYAATKQSREVSQPDGMLQDVVESVLSTISIPFVQGTNISVPAVTFQLPHANEEYARIRPDTVEMELASCYARAQDFSMRAAGILVISDNKKAVVGNKKEIVYEALMSALKSIIENISSFELEALSGFGEFCIHSYLEEVTRNPEDTYNVYAQTRDE